MNTESVSLPEDDDKKKKLTVIFPGIGYHCDKPLLYYSRKLAAELGYEKTICLTYTFSGGNIRGNLDKMKEAFDSLSAQAAQELELVDWTCYDDILFLSKSIGTVIASFYAAEKNITCRQVLYTPLTQTYEFAPKNGIAFLGTDDPWSIPSEVIKTSRTSGIPIEVYEHANHSLETTDTMRNLAILSDVMQKTKTFLIK